MDHQRPSKEMLLRPLPLNLAVRYTRELERSMSLCTGQRPAPSSERRAPAARALLPTPSAHSRAVAGGCRLHTLAPCTPLPLC